MAASVAAPLERVFATIPGDHDDDVESGRGFTATSSCCSSISTGTSTARRWTCSRRSPRPAQAAADLPAPPSFRKVNPADIPILFIALASSDPAAVGHQPITPSRSFAQQISQMPGVAQVQIFGQQKFAVRVQVDPDKAAARGLTLTEIGQAVTAANSNTPGRRAQQGQRQNVTLEATGQMEKAEDFAPLVVAWRNGAPVRVSDEVARVIDSVENDQVAAWFGLAPRHHALAVYRQPDANTVQVVDDISARLPA
jgi:HAE1 family hydrophobic/amphiphilic exporter-1